MFLLNYKMAVFTTRLSKQLTPPLMTDKLNAQTQVTESFHIVCVTNNSHLLYVSVNAVLCKFFFQPPIFDTQTGPWVANGALD